MKLKSLLSVLFIAVCLPAIGSTWLANGVGATTNKITLNVLLDVEPSEPIVADLAGYGTVLDVISELKAVVLQTQEVEVAGIRSLSHVVSARIDTSISVGTPEESRYVQPITAGRSTFNQDAINVTNLGVGRTVGEDGEGVYVAMIDTGLVPAWRSHLPKRQVNIGYARAFNEEDRQGKGLGPGGSQAWETDPTSHGTFLAAMILGFDVDDPFVAPGAQGPVEGSAPASTLIPIRITWEQDGQTFTTPSVLSRALVYAASLKQRSLSNNPVVICLAVVFPHEQPIVREAMNYAIAHGLIVVVAAGNNGEEGMAYPAAYAEAISVGASGWIGQWQPGPDGNSSNFWRSDDVPDPTNPADFYITEFSSRQLTGQYLDVIAPGHLIFGPGQLPGGPPDHFFGGGTSASVPHVAGVVALMAQKRPRLTQAEAEEILKRTAIPIDPGCRSVLEPLTINTGVPQTYCWGADATGSGLLNAAAALAATTAH